MYQPIVLFTGQIFALYSQFTDFLYRKRNILQNIYMYNMYVYTMADYAYVQIYNTLIFTPLSRYETDNF